MRQRNNTARARRNWLAAVAAAALALAGAAAAGSPTRAAHHTPSVQTGDASSQAKVAGVGLKNFGRVNEHYYRGPQPGPAEFAELKRLGIKTVIDLRKDSKREAPEWVRAAGMRYVNLPLVASKPATAEETEHFLKLVNDPANWPVYVHCKGGRHRTGALTAVYRITQDGWTADRAFEEMLRYDFDNGGFFGGGGGRARQKKFVYDFYARFSAKAE
jgi:tyrosine-protein phosphatase SIW14